MLHSRISARKSLRCHWFTIVPVKALGIKSTAKIMALCLTCALAQAASSQTGTTSGTPETSAVSAIPVSPSTAPSGDAEMADRVRQEFRHAWDGYRQYAWGHDALKPLSKSYHDCYSA